MQRAPKGRWCPKATSDPINYRGSWQQQETMVNTFGKVGRSLLPKYLILDPLTYSA